MDDRIRVLLVDDEEPFLQNLARLLDTRGFEVITALDGFKALEVVRSGSEFDVVVLDLKMPGMDGIETLRKLKEIDSVSEVIMLTGHASFSSGTNSIREGAYDYLMKPFDVEDLTEKIHEAYDVEAIKRNPVLWPRARAEEITLCSFKKLDKDDSLARALEVLRREEGEMAAEILFIIDHEERLLGLVTRRDLINESQKVRSGMPPTWGDLCEDPTLLPDRKLGQIMSPPAMTAHPEESLMAVAGQMLAFKVRRVPVIDTGKMIGVIRLEDVLDHVGRAWNGSEF